MASKRGAGMETARTAYRPGGLPCLGVLLLLPLLGSCAIGEAPPPPAPELALEVEGPAIRDGLRDPDEGREAARLLGEGELALRGGDPGTARARALEVEERLPEAVGSARALWLRARAAWELEAWEEADVSAGRFRALITPEHPAYDEVQLLRVRARVQGQLPGAIEALFGFSDSAPASVLNGAEEVASEIATGLEVAALRDLVREAPRHPVILPVFYAELAVRRYRVGEGEEARRLAQAGLDLDPSPAVRELLSGVIRGDVEEAGGVLGTLGAMLPESGSPQFQQLAAEIRAGIEVALVADQARGRRPVRLRTEDDAGDAGRASATIRSFEAGGALGVVGPLTDGLLSAAAHARSGPLPIISPTARLLPSGAPNTLSLTGLDPAASEALARLARSRGITEVVLLHPASEELNQEAFWFREAFQAGGGSIRRTFSYPPGATTLRSQMEEIVLLRPRAVVLLLPPDDIEMVSGQLSFYGVRDLDELVVMGNDAWGTESVLRSVNRQLTDGVLTVTPRAPDGSYGPGWSEFERLYEEHFRRTLRSPIPGLGYDAARLLLHAAVEGGGTIEGTARALHSIREFPGATGLLSIVDGRIQRAYFPGQIQNQRVVPLTP